MLWDDLRGQAGGKEAQERGDICILIVESRCCAAETNTTLESNYIPIKTHFKKMDCHYSI